MARSLELAGRAGVAGAESPDRDWEFARLSRANLLLVGAEMMVSSFLCSLWSNLAEPVAVRRRGERLRLPPSSEPVGTMILHAVDTLTDYEQRALKDWLTVRNGQTRVISTASTSLLPMVEACAFSDWLYYRLNVVRVDLQS